MDTIAVGLAGVGIRRLSGARLVVEGIAGTSSLRHREELLVTWKAQFWGCRFRIGKVVRSGMDGWDGQGQGQDTRVTTYNWNQKTQGPEVGTWRSCLEKGRERSFFEWDAGFPFPTQHRQQPIRSIKVGLEDIPMLVRQCATIPSSERAEAKGHK